MGVPAIASDIGGFAETIQNDVTGWLVPSNDAAKLALTIAAALRQPPGQRKAMMQAAMEHAHTHYDKRKMVADTLAVYGELVQG